MGTPAERFREEILRCVEPGGVYTFVGAGGKSTAIKRIAGLLAETGLKARMTTTTRVGLDEFEEYPICLVRERSDVLRAQDREDPILLLAGGVLAAQGKYAGIDPRLIDSFCLSDDTVLLVEGDGSRRLPMKVPREGEPVIPSRSRAVLAFMGASAFGEPVDERRCYEHERALVLLGKTGSFFTPEGIAVLAAHPDACRKGVMPGMALRIFVNQGDLDPKREIAREALRLMKERDGTDAVLASFQRGELYGTTAD